MFQVLQIFSEVTYLFHFLNVLITFFFFFELEHMIILNLHMMPIIIKSLLSEKLFTPLSFSIK